MLTDPDFLPIAMEQSALELGCEANDFCLSENKIVPSRPLPKGARKYLKDPMPCSLVSYGNNVVASVADAYRQTVSEYLSRFLFYHCFEVPNLQWLDERMQKCGQATCFMAEYYLPRLSLLTEKKCDFSVKILTATDFSSLYRPEWGNALCKDRRELDVLGVGAYDGEKLVGLAGCSADCEKMWQIGVDVLPAYRRLGIASALTSRLALEILDRGKVPFYCSAWSNLPSVRNAVKSGFLPAWVETSFKPKDMVRKFNGENE